MPDKPPPISELLENPDLDALVAEVVRLRVQNDKLEELYRLAVERLATLERKVEPPPTTATPQRR